MKIHFIGCLGASMSVLMNIVRSQGIDVSGSDVRLNGHSASNIDNASLVVYTSAVDKNNSELLAAKKKGIRTVERGVFLGDISKHYKNTFAVSGTHGKTTTTAMLACILKNYNPTVHVGGNVIGCGGNRVGERDYFITEACEYKANFLHLAPTIAVILNIDLDHTDFYKDDNDFSKAFLEFSKKSKLVIVHEQFAKKLRGLDKKIITFGCKTSDYYAENIDFSNNTKFVLYEYGVPCFDINLNVFGNHNIWNALAAIAVARTVGVSFEEIAKNILDFKGVQRRFEVLKNDKFGTIVSDYAHHPNEIIETIKTARQLAKNNGRIRIIFEPHTFTRTKSFATDFVNALSAANDVVFLPIYPAREEPLDGITSDYLKTLFNMQNDKYSNVLIKENEIIDFVKQATVYDITIFMGAGDIDALARNIIKKI